MIVEIDGLTKAQEIAVSDFFAKIKDCVDNDVSRWVALFADGAESWDGVTIKVDGSDPINCGIPANFNRWWNLHFKHGDDYSPEPFYLAESYSVQEALNTHEENKSSQD